MKKIFYTFGVISLLTFYSCTDESTFRNPATHALEKGAFVRFVDELPPATFQDAQNIAFNQEIYSPDNNVIDYTVTLKATVSGTAYIAENFYNTTTLPAPFSFTSQSMADALGLDVSVFGFGDSFEFIATATRTDGVKFHGVGPTFDPDALIVGIGNTEENLNLPSYVGAMSFGTIISCPFVIADMIGTYTMGSGSGLSLGDDQFEIIAGSNPNQIILVNPFDSSENYAVEVEVDANGLATIEVANKQNVFLTDEVCCPGYSPTSIATNPSLVSLSLSCIGYLELNINNFLGIPPSTTGFGFGSFTQITATRN